jgi:hypothetical protein
MLSAGDVVMSDVDVKAKAMEIISLSGGMPLKEFQGALLIALGAVNAYMNACYTAQPKEWDQWPRSQD